MPPIKNAAADLQAVGSFKALFETAPDGMLVVDAAGRIVLINPQLERLFGYRAEELAGQPVELLIPERLHSAHIENRKSFDGAPRTRPMGSGMDLLARRKNGEEFPVEIALSPLELDPGSFVVASVRDITETQRARHAMKRARYSDHLAKLGETALASHALDELLAAIPQRIAAALQVEVIIVYLLDSNRARLLCKGAFGLTADQVAQLHEANLPTSQPGYVLATADTVVVEDYAAETRFDVHPLMAVLGLHSSIGVPLSDGRRTIGTLTARAAKLHRFKDDEASFLKAAANIVSAAIDRLRTEEQLQHSQRLESIGQLTGGIAHDFNNLLTVISGNLQMIEDEVGGNPTLGKSVAAAMRATSRGAELTRKLLAFSRRQTLRPQAINLAQHLPNLLDMLNRTLGEHIDIRTHVATQTLGCIADPGQLDNALLNLALNARDAMPRGGRLTIECCSTELDGEFAQRDADFKPGHYVEISVTDTGSGMAPEVLAHAFEPFFTTKDAGKGSGLGLSMVYGFVKQSGGHLAVYSELGLGTTIRLYLPPSAEVEAEVRPHAGSVAGHGEHLLVVEDDPDVRELAVRFLTGLGYRVSATADATSALEILDANPDIALLFTDVILAGSTTGPALAREALDRRPGLKVLLTTGYARGALPIEQEGTAFPLLRKPYRREELAQMVRDILPGR